MIQRATKPLTLWAVELVLRDGSRRVRVLEEHESPTDLLKGKAVGIVDVWDLMREEKRAG